MKGPVRNPNSYSFNAAAKTVTFTSPIPAQQEYILGILNVTRNTFIYLPVEPGFGGTYDSGAGVLTLAFDTITHANGDVLQVFEDDTTSGATSALQATGNASLGTIVTNTGRIPAQVSGRTPVDPSGVTSPISAAALPLPAGAATSALQTTGNTSLDTIATNTGRIPAQASGRTPVDPSGVTSPISAAALPLPAGAATSALQTTGNTSLSTIATNTGRIPAQVSGRTPVDPSGVTSPVSNASLDSIDSKTPALVSGKTPVDPSGVTSPVSAAALPLPAGASTSALQTTANTSLGTIATNTGRIPAQVSGRTPVEATFPLRTPTTTSITNIAASTVLRPGNVLRRGLFVWNDSTTSVRLSFDNPATVANSFVGLGPGDFMVLDAHVISTVAIYALSNAANGTTQVTELV